MAHASQATTRHLRQVAHRDTTIGIGISPLRRCRSIATACSANSFHCFAESEHICLMLGPGTARVARWHSMAFLRQASAFGGVHSIHSVAFANELNKPCQPRTPHLMSGLLRKRPKYRTPQNDAMCHNRKCRKNLVQLRRRSNYRIVYNDEMMGMGFPETARLELMTPTANAVGRVCLTRRSAGFFVPHLRAQSKDGGNG
jgi:hypothetical protein